MLKLDSRGVSCLVIVGTLAMGRAASSSFPPDPDRPDNDADWFRAFVGYQFTYDNNLFRLPSNDPNAGALLPPGASEEDHINTGVAGFDGHWLSGRQSADYHLEVDDNRFVRNDYLNNTSGSGKAVWNWSLQSNLSGQAGADYTRTLAGFADTFFYIKNVVDLAEYFGNVRYQIGPRWAVYGSITDANTTNGAYVDRFNNFDLTSGKVGIEIATSIGNTIGGEYRYAHGHYPDSNATLNGVPYNPDFDQNSAEFLAKYSLTDKTVLSGDVGYLKRDYPYATFGAFSGDIWHVNVQWQATDKTRVVVTGSRELQAYLGSDTDYYVQTGISISPVWVQSEKLTWTAIVSWYTQDYISSSPSVLILGSRRDNLSAQQIGLTYIRSRWLLFNFAYLHQLRSSNQPLLGYDDDIAQAGIKFRF